MALVVDHLAYAYTSDRPVLRDLSFSLEAGKTLFILGRNGSGKSTLLNCLAGILTPDTGQVQVDGRDLHSYSPAERARLVGLIPQIHIPAFAYTVREMVLMGRAPHLGLLQDPSREDYAIVDRAIENVGIGELRQRPYTEISGGERQLVLIARGLAQQARILLMDEPSAHLDLGNQHHVLDLVDHLAQEGLSFVITSHAPNNALIYADQVMLLNQGRILAHGAPQETLTEDLLSAAYGMRAEVIYGQSPNGLIARAVLPRRPLTLPPDSLALEGSLLHSIFEQSREKPQLLLITGVSGVGKTTWCRAMAEAARQQSLKVRGLLSPPVYEGDRKVAIDLVNLETDEGRRLAVLRGDQSTRLATVQWAFDPQVTAWGDAVLAGVDESDLLIIDELGPLEFVRGQGLVSGLQLLDGRRYRLACVVVRSSLLAEALQRWPHAQVINGLKLAQGA